MIGRIPLSIAFFFLVQVFLVITDENQNQCGSVNEKWPNGNTSLEDKFNYCVECVKTFDNKTMSACNFFISYGEDSCAESNETVPGEGLELFKSIEDCINFFHKNDDNGTTTTSTTPTPSTTTSGPTTTTTSSPAPPTNGTEPTTTTKPTTTSVPTTKPTESPSTSKTTSKPPTPAPSSFSFANFFGGIVFTLAVSALAYVVWRFYKARNPNYHTLSTNLI